MLQVDDALVGALHDRGFTIAIESNGTLPIPRSIDWICVSPKAGSELVQLSGDELKLVWPQLGSDVARLAALDFKHQRVQSIVDVNADANVQACIDLVMDEPNTAERSVGQEWVSTWWHRCTECDETKNRH